MKRRYDINVKPIGVLSKNQVKTVRKSIENLINYVAINYDKKKSIQKQRFVNFVTLTLPDKQVHHDRVLRKSLSRFMDNMKKSYQVDYYVWKAEPQKNGNIHFHILMDRWVDYKDINRIWNNQLEPLGYLNKHKNPNSTDVHSLKNIKNATSYMVKYMTKKETDKRPIVGALWGASNELKKMEYPTFYDTCKEFDDILSYLYSSSCELKEIKIDSDYVYLFVGNVFKN